MFRRAYYETPQGIGFAALFFYAAMRVRGYLGKRRPTSSVLLALGVGRS